MFQMNERKSRFFGKREQHGQRIGMSQFSTNPWVLQCNTILPSSRRQYNGELMQVFLILTNQLRLYPQRRDSSKLSTYLASIIIVKSPYQQLDVPFEITV